MSPQLKKFLVDRSTGQPTSALDPLCEEMFLMYMSDVNSSTLREAITVLVAGYDPVAGKKGRDAVDVITGKPKEAKPKSYTPGKSSNGRCVFSDYTRERMNKDMEEDLDIIHSLFVGDRLAYVVEFNIRAPQPKLEEQIRLECEAKGQRYVRSCHWTYKEWIHHPSTKIHYIDWNLINSNKGCINKNMHKAFQARSLVSLMG
jgi:hypothetical protein